MNGPPHEPTKPSTPISMARSWFPPEDIEVFRRETAGILAGRVSMGPWVEKFEQAAAKAHGRRFAIATSSCTAALEIALLAAGVAPGDRVIVPVQTFIATGMAVQNIGAVPVFADIRAETLCLDPAELERLAEPAVKAVLLVHFGGLIPPDVEPIRAICRERGWTLVEDAAHAHGARYLGQSAGSFGAAACFSYYPTKVLTTGEGGMIVTDDEGIAAVCRSYQRRGQDPDLPGEQYTRPFGRNVRLPELSALLGVLQYGRLDEFVARRRMVAAVYDGQLAGEPSLALPQAPRGCFHNYWQYPVFLPPGVDRRQLKERMRQNWEIDVDWSYYPPLHLMPVFRQAYGTQPGTLPVAEDVLERLVCLPVHPCISLLDAAAVAQCFLHEYRFIVSEH